MKKELLVPIVSDISTLFEVTFIELDCGAAHMNIARYLLKRRDSELAKCLADPGFWEARIASVRPIFERSQVFLENKIIKKILKVALYTSLNGGNPVSAPRLTSNLTTNCEEALNAQGEYSLTGLQEKKAPFSWQRRQLWQRFLCSMKLNL
jgi:hypothetical protein